MQPSGYMVFPAIVNCDCVGAFVLAVRSWVPVGYHHSRCSCFEQSMRGGHRHRPHNTIPCKARAHEARTWNLRQSNTGKQLETSTCHTMLIFGIRPLGGGS
eukprot:2694059-Amphidinium_carterae.2